MPKFQSLKGFRDFYPEEFARRAYVINTWRQVAKSFGFQEYDGPPLESLDLYRHKSGDELVGQLYSFVDKGGREVALRPEMTPSVARMVAERWQTLRKPVRWFAIPQLFRYERPQAGRLREHFQFNADIFGDASPVAEAQILALLISAFERFGLTPDDIQIRLSDRRVLNKVLHDIGVMEQHTALVYSVLDKYHREPVGASAKRLTDAGVTHGVVASLFATVEKFHNSRTVQGMEEILGDHVAFLSMLNELNSMVVQANRWITFDLTIVRGLGYYTGTVFEAFDTRGKFRAICGGGRYDGLLESVGGPSAPAVGVGWGDVVLTELLADLGKFPKTPPLVDWIVAVQNLPSCDAQEVARELRGAGFSALALTASEVQKMSQQTASQTAKYVWTINTEFASFMDTDRGVSRRHRNHREIAAEFRRELETTGAVAGTARIREIVDQKSQQWMSISDEMQ